jgi:hypothetical protein
MEYLLLVKAQIKWGKKDEILFTSEVIKHAFGNTFLRVITQEQTLIKDIYRSLIGSFKPPKISSQLLVLISGKPK